MRTHDLSIAAQRIGPAWTLGPTSGVTGASAGSDIANEGILDIDDRNPRVELGDDQQVVEDSKSTRAVQKTCAEGPL